MDEKEFKHLVFIAAAIAVVLIASFAWQNASTISYILPLIALAAVVVFLFSRFNYLLLLKEYERAVVYRFGKVNRVGGPGWVLLLPPIEAHKVVDLRAKTLDIPPQDVITRDNIEVKIDAVIYLKVNKDVQSVINSVTEVDDYIKAAELFVTGLIRNQAGTMTLEEIITSVTSLNQYIKKELEGLSKKWGVTVEEVTITDITPPKSVQDARHELEVASRNKLARMESAEAHKAEIEAVRKSAEHLSDRALAYYYVKALEKLGEGQSSKIVFPMEFTELARALSSKKDNSAAIEELLRQYAPALKKLVEGAAKSKAAGARQIGPRRRNKGRGKAVKRAKKRVRMKKRKGRK